MAKLSIIYNNVADRASITANTTATGFSTDSLKNDQKTSVHRTTGNTAVYTLTWDSAQAINAIALPATNLQAGATINIKLYSNADDTVAVYNSGDLQACKDRVVELYNKTSTPDYTDFGFGAATKTSVWLPIVVQAKKLEITINSNSPIDCSRIICGKYWRSSRQVNNGIELGFIDASEITTTRSGNTYTDRKPIQETMSFDLEYLNDADRQQLQKLMRSWGSNALIYYCVFPDNTNPEITQSYSIYGRNSQNSLQYQLFSYYSSSLQLTSW